MSVLHALWLPILLSSVFVFILSFILHMALPWHKRDYRRLPNEDQVMDSLRAQNIPPGDYMLPRCETRAEMKSPAFEEKMKRGPVMIATVMPSGSTAMGRSLALWFLYVLAVSYCVAYAAAHAVGIHAEHPRRLIAVVAFLAYAGALWPFSIWYRRSWGTTFRSTVDGLVYAAATAATFDWIWPH